MKRPTPLDASRDFDIDEMFFSTTDGKGIIRAGNHVFERVSAYDRSELVGHAHNIIRHPDMPRSVFRLVWKHLLEGEPVAGFIKNLAKDGRYYWVVAHLTPIEGGFLSVRFKPSSALLPVVERVYREMVACEQAAEVRGLSRDAAMSESEASLGAALRSHGFDSYDAFMRSMLHDEMKSRDEQIAAQQLKLFAQELPAGAVDTALRASLEAIHGGGLRAYTQINTLYAQLDEFADLNEKLREKSAFVLGLTGEFRFIAFNAALRASRLGEEGRSLSVIAEYLGSASESAARTVTLLTTQIDAILGKLRVVTFNLAAARLQIEMVLSFCAELAEGRSTAAQACEGHSRMIEDLQRAFAPTIDRAVKALLELEHELEALSAHAEDMQRKVLTLQVAQVGGLVEAQRLRGDDTFAVMFADLRQGVDSTKRELGELDAIGHRLRELSSETPVISAEIAAAVTAMEHEVRQLAAATPAAPAPAAEPAPTVRRAAPEPASAR